MKPEEAAAAMKTIADKSNRIEGDPECDHYAADALLCKVLVSLGYSELVAEYGRVSKWYA